MPAENEALFRDREEILNAMVADMLGRIPDFHNAQDGVARLLFEIFSAVTESVFLSLQVLSEDMFAHTASPGALQRHGLTYGTPLQIGTVSVGVARFEGVGGTFIPIGSEIAYDPGTGADPLFFTTIEDGTIPNPGYPTAPTLADAGASTMPAGTYEYAITFETAEGETAMGTVSAPIVLAANRSITISNIPLGGAGTLARNLYENVNGAGWKKNTGAADTSLNNNTTTSVTVATQSIGGAPPAESTAERISLDIQSVETGEANNVAPNTITVLSDVPDGVLSVTNLAALTGGTEAQDTEEFRESLLLSIRNPGSGSMGDIKQWAEEVPGVDTATVFNNNNLGTAQNGHVTVRIAGPDGTVPSTDVQNAVLARLQEEGLANVIFHVTTFTQVSTTVTVDVTTEPDFTLADVSAGVTDAIKEFINNLQVGETLRRTELIAAIVVVPGIFDLDISTLVPATNLTTLATEKRIPGTITVT